MTPHHAPSPCLEAGCYDLAVKAGRCARCGLLHDSMKGPPMRGEYEQRRGSARQRGYDSRWEKRRRRHLEIEPTCRMCGNGNMGNEVDHVIPHRGAKWLFDLEGNLQTLCESHHAKKTAAERSIPIGMIYPLALPVPPHVRPTKLICGPRPTIGGGEGVVDEDGTTIIYGDEPGLLGARNRALAYGLRHGVKGPLCLLLHAPRTAERAFWAHVMGCEADLQLDITDAMEGHPPEWWEFFMVDQRAEAAMERRGWAGRGLTEKEYRAETQGTFPIPREGGR